MNNVKSRPATRRLAMMLGAIAAIVLLSLALPFTGLLLDDGAGPQAQAQTSAAQAAPELDKGFGESNPRANYWKAVRAGNAGYTAVRGPEAGVLIQNGGVNWRALRNGPIAFWGSVALAVMAVLIVLFHLLRGRVKIEGGRSGMTVPRWSALERLLHALVAISFVILLVTGLSMLYGRNVLIPVIGKDAFAAWMALGKILHNYSGPVFGVSLVLLLLKLLPANIPNGTDIKWFLSGGGLIGRGHSSAGRMNAGEKLWFWLLATFGVAVIVTGLYLILDPALPRDQAQTMLIVHAACALLVMAVAIGHVYIGTLGTEGSLEGMSTGRVDVAWAKQHHDLWYAEMQQKGVRPEQR
ncbi:MAG: formate dehydrogenase subunit gamma [Burkholderiaceae bacterium]